MKNAIIFIIVMLFLGISLSSESFAQYRQMGRKGQGDWGTGSPYWRMFDPNTIETIQGEIITIEIMTPASGRFGGVHLLVKTDKEEIPIHLGPAWYIENQDTKIEEKDIVEVKGSRITYEGKPALIAIMLKKGDEILKLRDDKGYPAWRGWRRSLNWKGEGGWGTGSKYGKMYDPKSIETIHGEVLSVNRITPLKGMSGGVHLLIKSDKEEISVHLGPAWYIENQETRINQNDIIEVKGSRITFDGKPALIAAQVKKGAEIMILRDENGFPVWSGWRRK